MSVAVELKGVDSTLRLLRDTEPTIYKQLIKEIRRILTPVENKIKQNTPTVSPFAGRSKDGFSSHNGRTAWSPIKTIVQVTPFSMKRTGSARKFVSVTATGSTGIGFDIVDMAGRNGSQGRTKSGKGLISNLPGRASRYAYPAVEAMIPQVQDDLIGVINEASKIINRQLDRI